MKLHHAQITIPRGSESVARDFYGQVLGLREIDKPESFRRNGGLWFQVGESQVHLGIQDGVDRHQLRSHLAFQVEDFCAQREKLNALGVEILEGIGLNSCARFEFRDPFGNRLELIDIAKSRSLGEHHL